MTNPSSSNSGLFESILRSCLEDGTLDQFLRSQHALYKGIMDFDEFRQAVMYRALLHQGQFDGDTNAKWFAWLKLVARSVAVEVWRRIRVDDKHKRPYFRSRRSAFLGPDYAVELEDLVEWLMSGLTPDEVQIITLREFESLPFAEIAIRMGCSKEAAIQRHYRAILTLRRRAKNV